MALNLPGDWSTYSGEEKVNFFNTMGVTPSQLISAGVPQSDINWMYEFGGYNVYDPETEAVTGVKPRQGIETLLTTAAPVITTVAPVITTAAPVYVAPVYTYDPWKESEQGGYVEPTTIAPVVTTLDRKSVV